MTVTEIAAEPTVRAPGSVHWRIEPQGLFSRHFDLYQNDQFITTLQMQLWQEGCDFTIGGHDFAIRKPAIWKDEFQLVAGDGSVCDVRRKIWSRRFQLSATDQQWVLHPAGWFSTQYQLSTGSRVIGRISRADWWSRRRVAEFAGDVPPPIQVLAIFLVLVVAKRRSKSQ
jgi:uncharacterized protein YxjI